MRFGFDQRTRATNRNPSAPRWRAASFHIPSDTVTHDSRSLIAAAPKLPSVAPRSGISTRSVAKDVIVVGASARVDQERPDAVGQPVPLRVVAAEFFAIIVLQHGVAPDPEVKRPEAVFLGAFV